MDRKWHSKPTAEAPLSSGMRPSTAGIDSSDLPWKLSISPKTPTLCPTTSNAMSVSFAGLCITMTGIDEDIRDARNIHDPIQVSVGPMMRYRAKRCKEELNNLV